MDDEYMFGRKKIGLIGVTVRTFKVSDDKSEATICGSKDDGAEGKLVRYKLRCEQECCSSTWIEDVHELSSLIGHTILAVEDLPMIKEEDDPEVSGNYVTFYGFTMRTEIGVCTIDFRNSSNGYYGGSLILEKLA